MGEKRRQAVVLAALLAGVLRAVSASLEVEHSFDGSIFLPAGKIVGNVLSDSELSWQRPALTTGDLELLEKAANADGLYTVRVKTGKATLLTSIPATCLRENKFDEQATIHADRDGNVVAFNYGVPSCAPGAGGSSTAGDISGRFAERTGRMAVRVMLPKPGPMLQMPEMAGEFLDVSVEDMGAMGDQAYDPNAKPRAASAPPNHGARKGGAPPKDDRTWLQKNWLYVAAGGMMVLNVIAKANAPPQGVPGAPGGGGGGGGGPRRG